MIESSDSAGGLMLGGDRVQGYEDPIADQAAEQYRYRQQKKLAKEKAENERRAGVHEDPQEKKLVDQAVGNKRQAKVYEDPLTQAAAETLRGLDPNFKEAIRLFALMPNMDVVVACGKGWDNVSKPLHFDHLFNPEQLSAMSKEGIDTAIAAGLLYKAGKVKQIVCSGGRTAGDEGMSEALAMKYVIIELFNISPEAIILDEESYSTGANAQYLRGMGVDRQRTVVLSANYHLPRVKDTFEREWQKKSLTQDKILSGAYAEGLPGDHFIAIASDVLVQKVVGNDPQVQKYRERSKSSVLFEAIREPIARLLNANKLTRSLMESKAKSYRSSN
jgi:hypothetical protein